MVLIALEITCSEDNDDELCVHFTVRDYLIKERLDCQL